MSDEPFYSPNRKPPAPRMQRTVGELLWEVHIDHVFWRAELFDEQAYGIDVRLFRGRELFGSRQWANREAAIRLGERGTRGHRQGLDRRRVTAVTWLVIRKQPHEGNVIVRNRLRLHPLLTTDQALLVNGSQAATEHDAHGLSALVALRTNPVVFVRW